MALKRTDARRVEQRSQRRAVQRRHDARERNIKKLIRRGMLNEPGADMLQAELDIGCDPDVYFDSIEQAWYVWDGFDEQRWPLWQWNEHCAALAARDEDEDDEKIS